VNPLFSLVLKHKSERDLTEGKTAQKRQNDHDISEGDAMWY